MPAFELALSAVENFPAPQAQGLRKALCTNRHDHEFPAQSNRIVSYVQPH